MYKLATIIFTAATLAACGSLPQGPKIEFSCSTIEECKKEIIFRGLDMDDYQIVRDSPIYCTNVYGADYICGRGAILGVRKKQADV